jgi:asparagine synthase (glutamine-hydrolysing)
MCGIAGGIWVNEYDASHNLNLALQTMRHRGPNDNGIEFFAFDRAQVGLGQTRLAIIDLSDSGHQPMHSYDGKFTIIFNGEIYNYRELRDQLKKIGKIFKTNSDTEVLLAAWEEWGIDCLPKLVGMFAFAVLDKKNQTLTCVRDAFGIKPFFYRMDFNYFRFASELPALLKLSSIKPTLNFQRSYDYLVHGDYESSEATLIEGVLHLLPGHFIEFHVSSGVQSKPKRWWTPKIEERSDLSFAQATEIVRDQFLDNIRMHLRSDVPLGAALSGGIDSSAVVCAMRYVEPTLPIHTFSFIASGSEVNEEYWVDRVNAHVGATPHKVHLTSNDLSADLDDMIKSQGEPFGSTSIYAQYRVFKLAKENGITVTLDGQGADEMLAGYTGYAGQRLRSLIEKGKLSEACSFLNEWSKWPGRSRLGGVKRLAAEMTDGWIYALLRKIDGSDPFPKWINREPLIECGVLGHFPTRQRFQQSSDGRRLMANLAVALTQKGLPELLRHGDRNSMRFSVESRVPFLTLEMVNLLLSLPESYLISSNGETKHIFRAAMRGIVPDEILNRRDKIGFATPEQAWLFSMAETVRDWLHVDLKVPFFNQARMLQEFEQIIAGKKAFSWQVWRWINFCRWHSLFIK